MSTPLLNRRRLMMAQVGGSTPTPLPNEIWVWPMNVEPSANLVPSASIIGTGEINGLKILKYDNPVTAVGSGSNFTFTPNTATIIILPEGFTTMPAIFATTQYVGHIYIPSTAQVYAGRNPFGAGSTGYVYHVWLAWNTPQAVDRMPGYDRVTAYHIRAGLKAAYIAAGWPEAKLVEDYEFNPWGQITRGGFTDENPNSENNDR